MGITRITYLFDIKGFREVFEPISRELEQNEVQVLKEKAHDLASHNKVSWKLLDQLSYFKDDFGSEMEEFEDIQKSVKFWIISIISSFCTIPRSTPLTPSSIAKLMSELGLDNEETIRMMQWGRPLGALLLPKMELKPALDRNDSAWPYWCKSYGSLGWLTEPDISFSLRLIIKQLSEDRMVSDESKFQVFLDILQEATSMRYGLFLGESA